MSLHRNVPRTQRERSPGNAMCREHRRDDGATGDRDGRCEVGAEIPAVLLVDDVFAEGNERPAPPLHVVVSRNYEHGSGLTHEIAERPPALEFAVPRALRQIARDDDGIRTQIGKGAFQRLDDLNVRHAAEVSDADVRDLNRHDSICTVCVNVHSPPAGACTRNRTSVEESFSAGRLLSTIFQVPNRASRTSTVTAVGLALAIVTRYDAVARWRGARSRRGAGSCS